MNEIVELVKSALQGDTQAQQAIESVMAAAQKGDPKAMQMAQAIEQVEQQLKGSAPVQAKRGSKLAKKFQEGGQLQMIADKIPAAAKGDPEALQLISQVSADPEVMDMIEQNAPQLAQAIEAIVSALEGTTEGSAEMVEDEEPPLMEDEVPTDKRGGVLKKGKKSKKAKKLCKGRKLAEGDVVLPRNAHGQTWSTSKSSTTVFEKGGCPCKLHRIGGKIVTVDCMGRIVSGFKKGGSVTKFEKPSQPIHIGNQDNKVIFNNGMNGNGEGHRYYLKDEGENRFLFSMDADGNVYIADGAAGTDGNFTYTNWRPVTQRVEEAKSYFTDSNTGVPGGKRVYQGRREIRPDGSIQYSYGGNTYYNNGRVRYKDGSMHNYNNDQYGWDFTANNVGKKVTFGSASNSNTGANSQSTNKATPGNATSSGSASSSRAASTPAGRYTAFAGTIGSNMSLAQRRQWVKENANYLRSKGWSDARIGAYAGSAADNQALAQIMNGAQAWNDEQIRNAASGSVGTDPTVTGGGSSSSNSNTTVGGGNSSAGGGNSSSTTSTTVTDPAVTGNENESTSNENTSVTKTAEQLAAEAAEQKKADMLAKGYKYNHGVYTKWHDKVEGTEGKPGQDEYIEYDWENSATPEEYEQAARATYQQDFENDMKKLKRNRKNMTYGQFIKRRSDLRSGRRADRRAVDDVLDEMRTSYGNYIAKSFERDPTKITVLPVNAIETGNTNHYQITNKHESGNNVGAMRRGGNFNYASFFNGGKLI